MPSLKALFLSVFSILLSSAIAGPTLSGLNGGHRTWSAKSLGHARLAVGFSGEGSQDENKIVGGEIYRWDVNNYWLLNHGEEITGNPFTLEDNPDLGPDTVQINELLDVTGRFFLGIGITDYFDIGMSLPVHFDQLMEQDKENSVDLRQADGWGIGDLEIMGKLQYPPYAHDHVFDMALMGIVTIPTGDRNRGFVPKEVFYIPKDSTIETRFFSAQLPSLSFLMLWTVDFQEINRNLPLKWHLNYGLQTTTSELLDNSFILSSMVEYKPNPLLTLFVDFNGQTRLDKFATGFDLGSDPLVISPGFALNTPNGMTFSLALDKGLSDPNPTSLSPLRIDTKQGPDPANSQGGLCTSCEGNGEFITYKTKPTTNLGVSVVLAWTGFIVPQDNDKDGIYNKEDACPDQREDMDGFQDYDGCPDLDNDMDDIEDYLDKCPMQPEDLDKFEDEDGCPEIDNDKDGIVDKKDKCPNIPEDKNGFEDMDGCPDGANDRDKDGIVDFRDKCPKVAEDKDGFQDKDGCPDLDNDKDGIPDKKDKCPDAAEVVNGFEDADGCPDAKPAPKPVIKKKARIVLHGVNFATGSAKLTDDSFDNLAEVAEQLKQSRQVVIEIRGYTDNKGSARVNRKLSQRRAESVVKFLISEGVWKKQLKAKGYGPKNPLASNRTAKGRAENRRIEMYRIK